MLFQSRTNTWLSHENLYNFILKIPAGHEKEFVDTVIVFKLMSRRHWGPNTLFSDIFWMHCVLLLFRWCWWRSQPGHVWRRSSSFSYLWRWWRRAGGAPWQPSVPRSIHVRCKEKQRFVVSPRKKDLVTTKMKLITCFITDQKNLLWTKCLCGWCGWIQIEGK